MAVDCQRCQLPFNSVNLSGSRSSCPSSGRGCRVAVDVAVDLDIDEHVSHDISLAVEPYSRCVALLRRVCYWEPLPVYYSFAICIMSLLRECRTLFGDVLYRYCLCYCGTSMITVVWLSLFTCMQCDPKYEVSLLRLRMSRFLLSKHDYVCFLNRFNPFLFRCSLTLSRSIPKSRWVFRLFF